MKLFYGRIEFRPVKKTAFIILIVLGWLVFNQVSAAENKKPTLTVQAAVDKTSVNIGDPIKYSITVRTGSNVEVEFPDFREKRGDFEVEDSGVSERKIFGRKKLVQRYRLKAYSLGEFAIPPAAVKYRVAGAKGWETAETKALEIEVGSVLSETETEDIRDIKGPLNLPSSLKVYILIFGLSVLLALVVWGVLIFKKKAAAEESLPPQPAHLIAYAALKELAAKGYIRRGMIKQYYAELSLIVRRYLENRFNLRAPEMTTEEFLSSAENSQKLSPGQKKLLKNFLMHCDLVKFARYGPSQSEIEASFQSARELVDQTKEENEVS